MAAKLFCHTSINLIVQNKWANFWSHRLCSQDKGGDLLTSSSSVRAAPSFSTDNWASAVPSLGVVPLTAHAKIYPSLPSSLSYSFLKSLSAYLNSLEGCRRKFCGFCRGSPQGDGFFSISAAVWVHYSVCSAEAPGCGLWTYTFQCPKGKPSVSVGVTLLMETIVYLLGLKRVSCDRHTDVTPDQNSW